LKVKQHRHLMRTLTLQKLYLFVFINKVKPYHKPLFSLFFLLPRITTCTLPKH